MLLHVFKQVVHYLTQSALLSPYWLLARNLLWSWMNGARFFQVLPDDFADQRATPTSSFHPSHSSTFSDTRSTFSSCVCVSVVRHDRTRPPTFFLVFKKRADGRLGQWRVTAVSYSEDPNLSKDDDDGLHTLWVGSIGSNRRWSGRRAVH